MGKTVALLVLFLAATATLSHGWDDTDTQDAKSAAEEFKDEAERAFKKAEEKGESWASWAYEKVAGGLGYDDDDDKAATNIVNKAGETASKGIETMKSAASESSNYVSEKAGDAANKAAETYEDAKKAASDAVGKSS